MNKIFNFNINADEEDPDKIIKIEELCRNKKLLDIKDVESLLRNLSYVVRRKIADYEEVDMHEYSYSYKCDLAQSMIYYYLNNLGIKANPVNTNEVIEGVCGHSLLIATFDTVDGEKTYLIDPTYIQFFSKENCDVSKYIIIKDKVCVSPDPGFFVAKGKGEAVILPLLQDGFIELTEEVAKVYGDSFFKTKQGVSPDEIEFNVASGSNYIRWFNRFTSKLSKSEEELDSMDLLIGSLCGEKGSKRK